jgi:DNA-binding PadR family transcriptional regulator
MEHPDYGYNLKNRISSKVLHDFGINDNQMYPTLKKLEKEGYVKKEVVYQEGSPNRNMYHIMEKGKKYFLDWLESDEGEEKGFRYEIIRKDAFIVRCIYILSLERDKAVQKVEKQIRLVEETVSDFTFALNRMKEKNISPLKVKILEFGLINQQARLEWLYKFLEFIKNKANG